jgi:hypothetical protein
MHILAMTSFLLQRKYMSTASLIKGMSGESLQMILTSLINKATSCRNSNDAYNISEEIYLEIMPIIVQRFSRVPKSSTRV